MKQTAFEIVRAQAQDAAELLDYLKTIGGETDTSACRRSPATICSCLPR